MSAQHIPADPPLYPRLTHPLQKPWCDRLTFETTTGETVASIEVTEADIYRLLDVLRDHGVLMEWMAENGYYVGDEDW